MSKENLLTLEAAMATGDLVEEVSVESLVRVLVYPSVAHGAPQAGTSFREQLDADLRLVKRALCYC